MEKKLTKRQQFLLDVMHEIDMLKKHATDAEKARLNFDWFDYTRPSQCIYGQLTGSCSNNRAKELMNASCIRVMHLGSRGIHEISGEKITSPAFNVNGEYVGQTWGGSSMRPHRSYAYLSALEGYIATKGAKNKAIIEYIKGNTDKLKL